MFFKLLQWHETPKFRGVCLVLVIINIRLILLSRECFLHKSHVNLGYDCEVSLNRENIKFWGIKSLIWYIISRVGVSLAGSNSLANILLLVQLKVLESSFSMLMEDLGCFLG